LHDEAKAEDSRWVHRPAYNWDELQKATALPHSPGGRIYGGLARLLRLRKQLPMDSAGKLHCFDTGNPHVLSFGREQATHRLLIVANLTESVQAIDADALRTYGGSYNYLDLLSEKQHKGTGTLNLSPYALLWLTPRQHD
jgi:amylosucrase